MIQQYMVAGALGTLGICIPAWVCVKLLQVSIGDLPAPQLYGAQEVYVTQDNPHQQ